MDSSVVVTSVWMICLGITSHLTQSHAARNTRDAVEDYSIQLSKRSPKPADGPPPIEHQNPFLYDTYKTCMKAIQSRQIDMLADKLANKDWGRYPVLYIDPSNHANFGDTLLSAGAFSLLSRFGYGVHATHVCRVAQAHIHVTGCGDFSQFKGHVKVAVWHPGGNWGDLYYHFHLKRIVTIRQLLANGIVVISLPQSLHYANRNRMQKDADELKRYIEETVGLERGKEMVVLTWRQKNSYQTALEFYPFVDNRLVPDTAFAYGPILEVDRWPTRSSPTPMTSSFDIIFVLRTDKESVFKKERQYHVIQQLLDDLPAGKGNGITFQLADWPGYNKNSSLAYFRQHGGSVRGKGDTDLGWDMTVLAANSIVSTGKVVITDRLHGSIFSFLLNKPHVYLENNYRKVSATREVAFEVSEACRDNSRLRYAAATNLVDALDKAIDLAKSL